MPHEDNFFVSLRTPDPKDETRFESIIKPEPALYLRVPFVADPALPKKDFPATHPQQAVDVDQWMDDLMARTPGYSKTLPAKRDDYGDPILPPQAVGGPWVGIASPITVKVMLRPTANRTMPAAVAPSEVRMPNSCTRWVTE